MDIVRHKKKATGSGGFHVRVDAWVSRTRQARFMKFDIAA